MTQGAAAGRRLLRLSLAAAALAAAAIATFAWLHERQHRGIFEHAQRAGAEAGLALAKSRLDAEIAGTVELLRGAVAALEPQQDPARFARFAAHLARSNPVIRDVTIARGDVITDVYPVEDSRALIGLNYRDYPPLLEAVEAAFAAGDAILSGPVEMPNGADAFVLRAPVTAAESESAAPRTMVSIVLDAAALFGAAGLSGQGLDIAVRGDGAGRDVRFGDPDVFERDPVMVPLSFASVDGQIAAVPVGGWGEPAAPWGTRGLFLLVGLFVCGPILAGGYLGAWRRKTQDETRQREAELEDLSWRLEFALSASEIGIWDADLRTDTLVWDRRAREIFGFEDRPGPFSEADWLSVLHPDDGAQARALAETAVSTGEKFAAVYRIIGPGGGVRHIRDVAAVYRGDDGSHHLVGLMQDVTADVERQEELNLRRLEAEAATVAKSRFLAAMSHEIRTPMSGVIGLLGLMLDRPLSAKQRERASIAMGSAQSLLEILNEILDFSKLEANQIRIVEEAVDIRALISEVAELMGSGAGRKGLTLAQSTADAVPDWIVTDPTRLRQILTNLVSNAIKFTEAGEVAIRAGYSGTAQAGQLVVEVSDTGIGIDPDQQDKIFQHFFQADNSLTRKTGGTGLGLAITKELVEMLGGGIELHSQPGTGSAFRFTIATRAATAPVPAVPPPAPASIVLPPMRILLAEDNLTNQYLIDAYLRAAGHSVLMVHDGAQAVAAARQTEFDAILMDVQMPVMDGVAATRAIRALTGRAGMVPIIALTANTAVSDRDGCRAAGMTDYLLKPIDIPALYAALQRAWDEGPGQARENTRPQASASGLIRRVGAGE